MYYNIDEPIPKKVKPKGFQIRKFKSKFKYKLDLTNKLILFTVLILLFPVVLQCIFNGGYYLKPFKLLRKLGYSMFRENENSVRY